MLVGGDDVDVHVARAVKSAVRRSCPGLSDDAVQVRKLTTFAKLSEESRDMMLAVGVDSYCQDIDQLGASMLVAQVGAARRDAEALAARIRHGASHNTLEAESLLERVTREELGLAARQSRELDVPDEMAVWRAR